MGRAVWAGVIIVFLVLSGGMPGYGLSPPCVPSCAGDLCGQDNGCGEPCPDLHKQVCGRCGNLACEPLCLPSCPGERCGQPDGCGGRCSDADAQACGKCGNQACCLSACEGARCGQDDGCGRPCPDADRSTCGLCGNPPCCVQEACGDAHDNDCDGAADEFCVLSFAPPLFRLFAGQPANEAQLILSREKASLIVRISGLLGLLFIVLSGLVGAYRFYLIRRYKRKPVINYHTYLGVAALAFVAIHMVSLLFDIKWNDQVTLARLLLPGFSSADLVSMAFGVLAFYLLLVVVLSGFTFLRLTKILGYKRWLIIHQASFIMVLAAFWHAKRLGSDFELGMIVILFVAGLLLLFFQVLTRNLDRKHLHGLLEEMRNFFAAPDRHPLADLAADRFVDKPVSVLAYVSALRFQWFAQQGWVVLHDDTSQMLAYSATPLMPGFFRLQGVLRKSRGQYFLEAQSVTPAA